MIFRSIFVASYLLGVVHKAAPCPEVPDGGCSVCGIGKCVQAPSSVDLSAILPKAMSETMTTCGDVQQAGYEAYRDSTIELCGVTQEQNSLQLVSLPLFAIVKRQCHKVI